VLSNLGSLVRYRGLIQVLVARDLKARYRGSALGFVWSFVNPLLLLSIYSFVFTTVMPGSDSRTQPVAVFLFCGLLPWTWFSASLTDATSSLISSGNLIKKVLFPAEVLPVVSVLTNMVHFLLGLPILALFMLVFRHYPAPSALAWFPFIVAVQLVFTLGLAFALSALTVHFRDVRDLLTNVLTLWFFATPIIYPYFMPTVTRFLTLFRLNPFYHLAVSYQESLFFGEFGHARSLLLLAVLSVIVFLGGYSLFDRLRDSFAEAV
jgi:lipopolysaccharide transport system permease protein